MRPTKMNRNILKFIFTCQISPYIFNSIVHGNRKMEEILEKLWGVREFRPLQKEAIDAAMRKKDVLVIIATGGGKSLCYQMVGILLNKPVVVITPLISLMQDQVHSLNTRGISACYLGSAQQDMEVWNNAFNAKYNFVYIPQLI